MTDDTKLKMRPSNESVNTRCKEQAEAAFLPILCSEESELVLPPVLLACKSYAKSDGKTAVAVVAWM